MVHAKGRLECAGVYLLSLVAIILWGMSYLWSDSLIGLGICVEYIVLVRIAIAGLCLLALSLLLRKNIRMRKEDLPKFLLISLFEPLIYFICETYGIKFTESPTISSLFIASSPIFSVFAGMLLFNEKFSIFNMFGILVCLGGIVMVTLCASSVGQYFIWGLLLLLVAVLSEVGYASLTKCLSRHYEPLVIVMYQFLIGSLYLLPLFLVRGLGEFNAELYLSWAVWKPILCLALFCSSIAFVLWANTIKYLGVARSSIFMSMIPVCTAIVGYLLGSEVLTLHQWIGIAVSCVGVVITQYRGANKCSGNSLQGTKNSGK